jgi:hypothetical protein
MMRNRINLDKLANSQEESELTVDVLPKTNVGIIRDTQTPLYLS